MTDRFVLDDDIKKMVIDLSESKFIAPDVGLNDEPVRYYRANEQWASIFEGLLNWLTEITAWAEAEDESHIAIQATLEFIEGINTSEGIIVTTHEELCEAVRCGILKVFSAAVAGQPGNIVGGVTIGTDGEIIVNDDGGIGVGASASGGVARIQLGLDEYLADMQAYWDDGLPEVTAEQFLTSKYLVNAGITQAVIDYHAYRDTAGPVLPPLGVDLRGVLYCEGANKQTTAGYIIDEVATSKTLTLQIFDALTQEQYDEWFASGSQVENDDYILYPCVPIADISYIRDNLASPIVWTTPVALKANHVYRFTFSGVMTNATHFADWFYYDTLADINPDLDIALRFSFSGAGLPNDPPVAKIAYDGSHEYIFTMTTTSAGQLTITRNLSGSHPNENSNPLSILIEDLGEL